VEFLVLLELKELLELNQHPKRLTAVATKRLETNPKRQKMRKKSSPNGTKPALENQLASTEPAT
jgi:hypothetical protein